MSAISVWTQRLVHHAQRRGGRPSAEALAQFLRVICDLAWGEFMRRRGGNAAEMEVEQAVSEAAGAASCEARSASCWISDMDAIVLQHVRSKARSFEPKPEVRRQRRDPHPNPEELLKGKTWLTKQHVAELLGVGIRRVEMMVQNDEGTLRGIKPRLMGKRMMFAADEIRKLLPTKTNCE